jgi:perosamine synthetase
LNIPYLEIIEFIHSIYTERPVPLHRPLFIGNEKKYLSDCIDSNFVSSAGENVAKFESLISHYTGAKHAIATVNGTAALHISLILAGVSRGDDVITQALTFVATCNAINYCSANPVFIDVDIDTMGMSPKALQIFLENNAVKRDGDVINKVTGNRISACVPMHSFGMPCRIREISKICGEWGIPLIEDAAESLGSSYENKHTGTFGLFGTLSFNGNKIITTGGGGMILTDNPALALKAKHLTTTAKLPHIFEFIHDEIGYNYRLPNLNAVLGCAQMEKIASFIESKKNIYDHYKNFFLERNIRFFAPHEGVSWNYWLNTLVLNSREEKEYLLEKSNEMGVMTRPVWLLMNNLNMFKCCQHDGLINSTWLADRVVNLPSSVPI